jgi:hypothetical protein
VWSGAVWANQDARSGDPGGRGASRFPRVPAHAAPPAESRANGRSLRGLRACPPVRVFLEAPKSAPSPVQTRSDGVRPPSLSLSFLFLSALSGPARSARRQAALGLVSGAVRGRRRRGRLTPGGPAAVMRLPPLQPGGQRAAAAEAGAGARSPLAGTPPWPALGSRGGCRAPGPGTA